MSGIPATLVTLATLVETTGTVMTTAVTVVAMTRATRATPETLVVTRGTTRDTTAAAEAHSVSRVFISHA
jgi:hypothetical protein